MVRAPLGCCVRVARPSMTVRFVETSDVAGSLPEQEGTLGASGPQLNAVCSAAPEDVMCQRTGAGEACRFGAVALALGIGCLVASISCERERLAGG
jgi:hypothetical protein